MDDDERDDQLFEQAEMYGEEISELKARIAELEAERARTDEQAFYALIVEKWGVQPCDFGELPTERWYQIREGQSPKVGGYGSFAASFFFDEHGNFVRMDIFE